MSNVTSTKPFCQATYDENDEVAKIEAVKFVHDRLGKNWVRVREPEQYKRRDIRFEHYGSKKFMDVETEVKYPWREDDRWMNWDTFDVPCRKKDSQAYHYICFNHNMTLLMTTKMATVLKSPSSKKSTWDRYGNHMTDKEPFFNVPIAACRFFKKEYNGTFTEIDKDGNVV
jgi:hypothetical protein